MPAEARRLARYSEGSLQRALELADPESVVVPRHALGAALRTPTAGQRCGWRQTVAAFVDEAGKEASARRGPAAIGGGVCGGVFSIFDESPTAARRPTTRKSPAIFEQAAAGPFDIAAARLDRCLDALDQIDRNANQATLIEAWLDPLAG